jgi:hypothetical protein
MGELESPEYKLFKIELDHLIWKGTGREPRSFFDIAQPMRKLLLAFLLAGCSADQYDPERYLSNEQRSLLIKQAVRYLYFDDRIPPSSRFDSVHNEKFEKVSQAFSIVRYHRTPEEDYYLILRRYGNGKFRAIGGKLRLAYDGTIAGFIETFVTPLLEEEIAEQRGAFLFTQMALNGDVDKKYLDMKLYVEWPDASTSYDTVSHQWIRMDLN